MLFLLSVEWYKVDRITSIPWDFVLIGKLLGTLFHWRLLSITERNSPPLQNSMSSELNIMHKSVAKQIHDKKSIS